MVPGDENCCGAQSCLLSCPACCAPHVVEVEHREAREEVGGNVRSAELAMPSARAAASCAASPGTGVHRHARVAESIFCGSVGALKSCLCVSV